MANFVQSSSYVGLQSATINIPTSDNYNFDVKLSLPDNDGSASQGSGAGAGTGSIAQSPFISQVIVTVKQNGSTIYTSQASSKGFTLNSVVCSAGDVITITPSSAQSQDQQLQAVKMVVSVSEGSI